MQLELNAKFAPKDRPLTLGNHTVHLCPPLTEDYYLARVRLGTNAIQCFPKFTTIGIGFAKEKDWNTNLPYTSSAETIWNHIKHNKADKSITKAQGIAAINLLQEYAASLREPATTPD